MGCGGGRAVRSARACGDCERWREVPAGLHPATSRRTRWRRWAQTTTCAGVATGAVTTLAGSGSAGSTDATGASASFKYPFGVAITPDGFTALVSDYGNHKIRSITFGIL